MNKDLLNKVLLLITGTFIALFLISFTVNQLWFALIFYFCSCLCVIFNQLYGRRM